MRPGFLSDRLRMGFQLNQPSSPCCTSPLFPTPSLSFYSSRYVFRLNSITLEFLHLHIMRTFPESFSILLVVVNSCFRNILAGTAACLLHGRALITDDSYIGKRQCNVQVKIVNSEMEKMRPLSTCRQDVRRLQWERDASTYRLSTSSFKDSER